MKSLRWLLFGVGPVLIGLAFWGALEGSSVWWVVAASVAAVGLAVPVTRHRERTRPNAMERWRSFRAIKQLIVAGEATERVTVTMDLTHEWNLTGEVVTLRFDGVRHLAVQQWQGLTLHFDYLIAEDRGADYAKGSRYRVADRWDEHIRFECDTFEEIARRDGESS